MRESQVAMIALIECPRLEAEPQKAAVVETAGVVREAAPIDGEKSEGPWLQS